MNKGTATFLTAVPVYHAVARNNTSESSNFFFQQTTLTSVSMALRYSTGSPYILVTSE